MPGRLKAAWRRAVGTKETLRALEAGCVAVVYVATDAEERLVKPVLELVNREGVELVATETMARLGRLCGIDVGTACAALLKERKTRTQIRRNLG